MDCRALGMAIVIGRIGGTGERDAVDRLSNRGESPEPDRVAALRRYMTQDIGNTALGQRDWRVAAAL